MRNNIKMDPQEKGCQNMYEIQVNRVGASRWYFASTIMDLQVPQKQAINESVKNCQLVTNSPA
jgi:hypothetical protein